VARLLKAAPPLKYKAALSVAYGAGLRVSEGRSPEDEARVTLLTTSFQSCDERIVAGANPGPLVRTCWGSGGDSNRWPSRGAGRSRATESDGGQARRAEGLQLTRANGDCGVDGVNSVGNRSLNEPRGWSWFRGDWCGCATA
jgi:hypothetical protein